MKIRKPPHLFCRRTHGAVLNVAADVTTRDCHQRQHSSEAPGRERTGTSTSSVIITETLEDRCKRLQEEGTAAEHQKMASEYQSYRLGWTE